MIVVDAERCNGCGACVEACPNGAIYLVDDVATVDGALCHNCEACIGVCPMEAITLESSVEPVEEPVRTPVPVSQVTVVRVRTQPAPMRLRDRVLPAIGTALVWAGREIVPRLADYVLDNLEDWATDDSATRARTRTSESITSTSSTSGGKGAGRRRRRRRRGG